MIEIGEFEEEKKLKWKDLVYYLILIQGNFDKNFFKIENKKGFKKYH